jgi:hypothetical protein
MARLEIQLSKGIEYSKSNFDLILTHIDKLQMSQAQARTRFDELVSSYNGTDLMRTFSLFKDFADCIAL